MLLYPEHSVVGIVDSPDPRILFELSSCLIGGDGWLDGRGVSLFTIPPKSSFFSVGKSISMSVNSKIIGSVK